MELRNPARKTIRNAPEKPLSEKQIVDATLMFANGTKLLLDGVRTGDRIRGTPLTSYPEEEFEPWRDEKVDTATLPITEISNLLGRLSTGRTMDVEGFVKLLRVQVREIISLSLRDRMAAATMCLKHSLINDVNFTCPDVRYTHDLSTCGLRLTQRFLLEGPVDLVIFGLFLLLDETRGFGQKLCQCQWEPCGLFFFEAKGATGRPQRRYCGMIDKDGKSHMEKAHDKNAPDRMKKRRRSAKGK